MDTPMLITSALYSFMIGLYDPDLFPLFRDKTPETPMVLLSKPSLHPYSSVVT